jgi:hypothetical protein
MARCEFQQQVNQTGRVRFQEIDKSEGYQFVISSKSTNIIGLHLGLHNKCPSARAVWNFGGAFECSRKWRIRRIVACCYRGWILAFISLPIHSLSCEIMRVGTAKDADNSCNKKSDSDHIFHWDETPSLWKTSALCEQSLRCPRNNLFRTNGNKKLCITVNWPAIPRWHGYRRGLNERQSLIVTCNCEDDRQRTIKLLLEVRHCESQSIFNTGYALNWERAQDFHWLRYAVAVFTYRNWNSLNDALVEAHLVIRIMVSDQVWSGIFVRNRSMKINA